MPKIWGLDIILVRILILKDWFPAVISLDGRRIKCLFACCGALSAPDTATTAQASRATGLAAGIMPGSLLRSHTRSRICTCFAAIDRTGQCHDVPLIKLNKGTALETARQYHGAITYADQATDCMPYCLEHPPHLTVAPFRNGDLVPTVCAFTTARLNGREKGISVIQKDTIQKALFFVSAQRAQYPHGVFTLKAKPGMHEFVRELTRTRQQEQSFGIEIKAADRLPFALKQFGQASKNCGPILRVIVRDDFTRRLVVRNHARRWRVNPDPDGLAIDLYRISELDTLPYVRRFTVDRDTPFKNELLHLQAGPQSSLRQHFVQLWSLGLRQQNPFG